MMQPHEWSQLSNSEKSEQSLIEAREAMAEIRPMAARIALLVGSLNDCLGRFVSYGLVRDKEHRHVIVRAKDLHAALVNCATAYGAHAKDKDGNYILPWFGRLAAALEEKDDQAEVIPNEHPLG